MAIVEPTECTRFRDIFCAVADEISQGLYTSGSAVANGHWAKWAALISDVPPIPLLILYRDPFSINNAFSK